MKENMFFEHKNTDKNFGTTSVSYQQDLDTNSFKVEKNKLAIARIGKTQDGKMLIKFLEDSIVCAFNALVGCSLSDREISNRLAAVKEIKSFLNLLCADIKEN